MRPITKCVHLPKTKTTPAFLSLAELWLIVSDAPSKPKPALFLPGALLMAMRAELLAPFVFVDFGFAPLLQ
jgi:hypothetical protein